MGKEGGLWEGEEQQPISHAASYTFSLFSGTKAAGSMSPVTRYHHHIAVIREIKE
jgi:hypothetical protein